MIPIQDQLNKIYLTKSNLLILFDNDACSLDLTKAK